MSSHPRRRARPPLAPLLTPPHGWVLACLLPEQVRKQVRKQDQERQEAIQARQGWYKEGDADGDAGGGRQREVADG